MGLARAERYRKGTPSMGLEDTELTAARAPLSESGTWRPCCPAAFGEKQGHSQAEASLPPAT